MKTIRNWVWLSGLALLLGTGVVSANAPSYYRVLHHFAGGASDGAEPLDSLLIVGTNFYGMTTSGGSAGLGTVDSDHGVLHSFTNSPGDGAYPWTGSLTIAGSMLYGMTTDGGSAGAGILFKISTAGTGYGVLHHFLGPPGDGSHPCSTPTILGALLYGTANAGGISNGGVIFSMNTNGLASTYKILHHFGSTAGDGNSPCGALLLSGNRLYGTTYSGGTNGWGTIYKMNVDGSGYAPLYHFFASWAGGSPLGGLVQMGGDLYGLTGIGYYDQGVVFKIGTNGNNYTVLHTFTGAANDGAVPNASLTPVGAMLYGTTAGGGAHGTGTVFKICTNGTAFAMLHSFAGGTNDGAACWCNLALSGTTLYGMTSAGGSNGLGVVFALDVVGPKLFYQEPLGTVAGWIMETNGLFQLSYVLGNTGGWKLKAAGDIDGDGFADLLFQNAAGDVALWYMGYDGWPRSARLLYHAAGWDLVACADYDNNGRAEIFFQRPDGTVAYWNVAANGDFQGATSLGAINPWLLRAAGDLDGDGKAELFWQNAAGWLAVWFHDGPGGTIRGQLLVNTGTWRLCGAGDMDGDGISDLLWQNPGGAIAGWFMNTNATAKGVAVWDSTGSWKLSAAGR